MTADVERGKVALLTGASGGFGVRTSLMLARQGWTVYAGLRVLESGAELIKEAEDAGVAGRIKPVRLDVTQEDQIRETVGAIALEAGRLNALIHNAGFAAGGFLEELPLSAWRAQFETNLFGVVALTREALPLMRKTGGNIVLVSSVSGRIGFPALGPYCASKHALEGLGESLRLELAAFGISVSIVEPGPYQTPIWRKSFSSLPALPPDSPYAGLYARLKPMLERTAAAGGNPERVAAAICRALSDKRPKLRYLPGAGERITLGTKALLPWRLFEAAALRMLGVRR